MNSSGYFVSTVLALLYHLVFVTCQGDDPMVRSCTKISSCKCKTPDLGDIDLEPLALSDGTPRFDKITAGIQEYSWNPCKSFSQGDCHDVAVCQKSTFPAVQYYNLGTQDTADFRVDDKFGVRLVYTASSWRTSLPDVWKNVLADPTLGAPVELERPSANLSVTFMRTSFVRLVCDLNDNAGTLIATGEDKNWPGRYYFTLKSYHACPSYLKPKPTQPPPSTLSVGSCLLIVCSVMLIFYLVVGSALQIFLYKRSGTDAIPNKTFWMSIPGLVKDGSLYVLKGRHNTGYSEV